MVSKSDPKTGTKTVKQVRVELSYGEAAALLRFGDRVGSLAPKVTLAFGDSRRGGAKFVLLLGAHFRRRDGISGGVGPLFRARFGRERATGRSPAATRPSFAAKKPLQRDLDLFCAGARDVLDEGPQIRGDRSLTPPPSPLATTGSRDHAQGRCHYGRDERRAGQDCREGEPSEERS